MAIDLGSGITWLGFGLMLIAILALYNFYVGASKKVKTVANISKGVLTVVMLIVGVAGLGLIGIEQFNLRTMSFGGLTQATPITPTTPQQPLAVTGIVSVAAEKVTKTLNLFEKYNPGTEVSTEYIDVYIEEYDENTGTYSAPKDKGRYAEGSSVDFSPNDRVTLVPAVNSTVTGYYGKIDTQIVGLSGTETYAGIIADASDADQAGMTITVNNVDGTVNSASGGSNQSIGAGQVKTLSFRIDGAYEDDYSTGKVCFACEYNKTAYDEVILTSDVAGSIYPAKSRDCPPEDLSVASHKTVSSYEMDDPITSLKSITGSITVDADDSNDPGKEDLLGTDSPGEVICSIHDQDVYIDSNDNLPKIGYETEKGADVGQAIYRVNMSVHII